MLRKSQHPKWGGVPHLPAESADFSLTLQYQGSKSVQVLITAHRFKYESESKSQVFPDLVLSLRKMKYNPKILLPDQLWSDHLQDNATAKAAAVRVVQWWITWERFDYLSKVIIEKLKVILLKKKYIIEQHQQNIWHMTNLIYVPKIFTKKSYYLKTSWATDRRWNVR